MAAAVSTPTVVDSPFHRYSNDLDNLDPTAMAKRVAALTRSKTRADSSPRRHSLKRINSTRALSALEQCQRLWSTPSQPVEESVPRPSLLPTPDAGLDTRGMNLSFFLALNRVRERLAALDREQQEIKQTMEQSEAEYRYLTNAMGSIQLMQHSPPPSAIRRALLTSFLKLRLPIEVTPSSQLPALLVGPPTPLRKDISSLRPILMTRSISDGTASFGKSKAPNDEFLHPHWRPRACVTRSIAHHHLTQPTLDHYAHIRCSKITVSLLKSSANMVCQPEGSSRGRSRLPTPLGRIQGLGLTDFSLSYFALHDPLWQELFDASTVTCENDRLLRVKKHWCKTSAEWVDKHYRVTLLDAARLIDGMSAGEEKEAYEEVFDLVAGNGISETLHANGAERC